MSSPRGTQNVVADNLVVKTVVSDDLQSVDGVTSRHGCCVAVKSPAEKTRYDTSLGLLTKRFVRLLTTAPDGVSRLSILDLACDFELV